MKKIVSILLALLMLSLSAVCFAEAAETPEVDLSSWVEVQLNDIGMHFYRPGDLTISEDPAADTAIDSCCWYGTKDNMTVSLFCIAANDSTLADLSASMTEDGYNVQENAFAANGLTYDHLVLTVDEETPYAGIIFQGSDGYFYDFECEWTDDDGAFEFGVLLGTLSQMQ